MKKSANSRRPLPQTPRNTVARNPLLGKSARHEKTVKAKRRAARIQLQKMPFERVAA